MTRDHFPFEFLLEKKCFLLLRLNRNVLKSFVISLSQPQRSRIDDVQIFLFISSFLSSEELSKQQLLLLLCLIWDFKCLLAVPVTANKCFCMHMMKTNSFQSHQRPGEQRWIQRQDTASVKCLTNKNILYFLHINAHSAVGNRVPPPLSQSDLYLNVLVQTRVMDDDGSYYDGVEEK